MIIILLFCLAYLFAGVGYYVTCKDRIQDLLLNKWEKRLVCLGIIIGVGIWLPILGFATIMTEIEWYIKRKYKYNY